MRTDQSRLGHGVTHRGVVALDHHDALYSAHDDLMVLNTFHTDGTHHLVCIQTSRRSGAHRQRLEAASRLYERSHVPSWRALGNSIARIFTTRHTTHVGVARIGLDHSLLNHEGI